MSEQVKGISERAPEPPYMDFPEAWAFVRTTKLEDHHMRCSWRSGVLCDCNVLWAEYYKRKAARSEQALADQYHAASQFADAIVRMDAEKVKHEQALAALEAQKSNLEKGEQLNTYEWRCNCGKENQPTTVYCLHCDQRRWSNLGFTHVEVL